jgi:predicted phosphodiesterase
MIKLLILIFFINVQLFAQGFKFIAMSDSRGINNGVNDSVLTKIVNHIIDNQSDVKFIIFAGDMVNGHDDDPERTYQELMHWKDVMAPIYKNDNMVWPKVWPVVGNHEIRHRKDEDNFRKVFSDVYRNGPDDEKGLSYSFDFRNAHFTIVNTDRWYYGDPLDTTDDRRDWHYIKHLDWLENDLKSARDRNVDHIFIASHDMIYPVGGHLRDGLANLGRNFKFPMDSTQTWFMGRRQKVIDILKKYKVAAHICGHEHLYGRQEVNGIFEVIAGSSGAPLYNFNPVYREDADSLFPGEEMSYSQAIPYYQALEYFYGPGENSQASRNFVGKRAFNYAVFDVQVDNVQVVTYGAFSDPKDNNKMIGEIKIIDEFNINRCQTAISPLH